MMCVCMSVTSAIWKPITRGTGNSCSVGSHQAPRPCSLHSVLGNESANGCKASWDISYANAAKFLATPTRACISSSALLFGYEPGRVILLWSWPLPFGERSLFCNSSTSRGSPRRSQDVMSIPKRLVASKPPMFPSSRSPHSVREKFLHK